VPPARWLGWAGLLPFAALAGLSWLVEGELRHFVSLALVAYGATIAAFLGGIHWGVAMRLLADPSRAAAARWHLLWGVCPQLLAWGCLLLQPFAGLPALAALIVACWLVDRRTWPALGLTPWLALRTPLSCGAAVCLLLAAAAA
jgi:hypothetical protein